MTILRIITLCFLYVLLLLFIMHGWWVLSAVVVVGTSLWFSPAPLIPIAVLLDGYFGAFDVLPVMSLSAVSWYILLTTLRPMLTVVQSEHV